MSPGRRWPRNSPPLPPPRQPLRDRIHGSPSPRSRSRSPRRYQKTWRPRTRTSTPISSSRGPSPTVDSKSGNSPRRVKPEPSTDAVPNLPSRPSPPTLGGVNRTAVDSQTPVLLRGSADRRRQPPSLNLSPGEHVTVTSDSAQQPSPLVDPLSPIFAPETPVIPGLSASVQLTQPNIPAISSLQKSLEQVMKDQGTGQPQPMDQSTIPATVPEVEKTEIWTTRVKCVEFTGFVKEMCFLNTLFEKMYRIGYGPT